MDHGVMKMRRMPDGVEIGRPETVELKPGGFHLMFTDLQARLVKSQSVRTLTPAPWMWSLPSRAWVRPPQLGRTDANDHMHVH